MKNLQIYNFSMPANGSFQLLAEGSYFRILTAIGSVNIIGDSFGKLGPINRGQGLEDMPYKRLIIEDVSGSINSGTILVSESNFIDQTLYGSITLLGQQGAFAQAAATVTNASALLAAANANRRYLLIQNNDGAGNIFVNLAGAAATVADGIKIAPGGSYEVQGFVPSGALYAIGDIASNANIVLIEG